MTNLAGLVLLTVGCAKPGSTAHPAHATGAVTSVVAADLSWDQLNPARGDQSPRAAALWGDRKGAGPSGFLVGFADGFSSPPHIHNVSYRGVVIHGLVHNDDPDAQPMWMPTGSYWTQPQRAAHITAASGADTVAYIEIDDGPYLVRPIDEAAPGPEHPLNAHATNLVWLHGEGPMPPTAYLWGDHRTDAPRGLLLQVQAGASAQLHTPDGTFRAVVVAGQAEYAVRGRTGTSTLGPGSAFGATQGAARLACESTHACTVYVRAEGRFDARLGE